MTIAPTTLTKMYNSVSLRKVLFSLPVLMPESETEHLDGDTLR
jgi:hypothetical protein